MAELRERLGMLEARLKTSTDAVCPGLPPLGFLVAVKRSRMKRTSLVCPPPPLLLSFLPFSFQVHKARLRAQIGNARARLAAGP